MQCIVNDFSLKYPSIYGINIAVHNFTFFNYRPYRKWKLVGKKLESQFGNSVIKDIVWLYCLLNRIEKLSGSKLSLDLSTVEIESDYSYVNFWTRNSKIGLFYQFHCKCT